MLHYHFIIKILFIIIICIFVFVLFQSNNEWVETCKYLKENFSQKKIAISFGGGGDNYISSVNRIHTELSGLNIFDLIIKYTDTELKKDELFWKKNGEFILQNNRGYGYWLWKPYIILKTLNTMDNGDILLYLDSGCEIIADEKSSEEMSNLLDKCNNNELLYTLTGQIEKKYNKMDLLKYMDMDNNTIKNSEQSQATIIFIKKNDKTYKLIEEWYTIACNYHFIDDSNSIEQNDSSFIEHRHDQSIFSLLTKKYSFNNNENKLYDFSPIRISRKRS